jgi:hypothetical protein
VTLHRGVAEAIQAFAGDLSEHLGDLALHWAEHAPDGKAATARTWALRAAAEAVPRPALEEGVRLYRVALGFDPASPPDAERCRVQINAGLPTSPATCTVAWHVRPSLPSS